MFFLFLADVPGASLYLNSNSTFLNVGFDTKVIHPGYTQYSEMIIANIFKINLDITDFEGNVSVERSRDSLEALDNIVKIAENL